jgi:hypothetical protein
VNDPDTRPDQYMPPMPPPIPPIPPGPGAAARFFSSGISDTSASVVRRRDAMDAEF